MEAMIPETAEINIVGIHVAHDDGSGSRSLTLPARSIILDAFAICTESSAGSPSMDFGTAADTDGIFSGLGEDYVCDTVGDILEDVAEYKGRGAYIKRTNNADDLPAKATKLNSAATIYLNTQVSAGTAGEWDLYIMYMILPEIG